jgi:hypothetical protein
MQANMQLRFVVGAVARHHETSDLNKIIKRKFDEGVADVQLSARHPSLARALPLAWPPVSRKARLLVRLAWQPRHERMVVGMLDFAMGCAATIRMRGRWRVALDLLLTYWYWRGVAAVLPTDRQLTSFLPPEPSPSADLFLDLAEGLARAEERLDAIRPASAALFYRGMPVAVIPAVPGVERLRGEHLRPLLATPYYRWALGEAALKAGAVPPILWRAALLPDTRTHVADTGRPLMGDEELTAHLPSGLDAQHRPAVPPAHGVSRHGIPDDGTNVVTAGG